MQRDFDVVIERDSAGYYVASVPSLPGCHTQARSLDELVDRVREAVELCLEVEGAAQTRDLRVGPAPLTLVSFGGYLPSSASSPSSAVAT